MVIGVLGCTFEESVYFTRLNDPPRPMTSRPPESVEIFQYARAVRPMTELGVLEVRNAGDPARALNRLRAEAGRIGCDGLLLIHGDIVVHGQQAFESPPNRATCFVYYPAPAPPAPLGSATTAAPASPPSSSI
jgi:hypothetical protein